ncbi:hypothetical protein Sta7437_1133 [Stanieria cyanosphaera PCC 7437]|uniref:Uncharacterized protein n=1 Tax=Stanieria cyanosphaera (strain ATCC 29371 / PCC 7437) TaxID=111780 RepID=K9XRM3_STAC7|nr:hypothetical protein Sta7437_1133 [Stanieria cyanosphaera PCC 7437]
MNISFNNYYLLVIDLLIFLLSPIVFVINIIIWKERSNSLKIKVAYLYLGLWLTSFISYLIMS